LAILPADCQAASQPSGNQGTGWAEQLRQTDLIFGKWDTTVSPGCALSVMRDGRIIYERGYGMADLDHDVTIRPDTVFHVASMSKQFTAAAVILLAQDGKLSLDDDVRKYLPELPDFGSTITIQHLIHHTSGIRDQWTLLDLAGWRYSLDLITDQDVLGLIYRQKELNFKPGARFLYNNTGYTLLGQIVQKVSGQSLREFTIARIFVPLGMNSTHFRDDHAEVVKHDAYGYEPTAQPQAYKLSITNFDTVGATGLLTTVEDLAKWDENFYHPRIGGAQLLKLMLQVGVLNNGEPAGAGFATVGAVYASGLELSAYRGLRIVEHNGADAGYRADLIRFPDQHFSVACLCNRADAKPNQAVREVADIFLAKEFTEPAKRADQVNAFNIPGQPLAQYAGLYWNDESQRATRLAVSGGKLTVVYPEGDDAELIPLTTTKFQSRNAASTYTFYRAKDSDHWQLSIQHDGQSKAVEYVMTDSFSPAPDVLATYAGMYVSDEIDPTFQMIADSGELTLRRPKHESQQFYPTIKDSFESKDGVNIHFQRDTKGGVVGFLWDSGRITNFRFRKVIPPIK
jgi:CubicO group peptidase (beta-lactamase class C family)